jgi:hypothetical protein
MIRAGLTGVAAVAVPGAALGAALVCSIRGLGVHVTPLPAGSILVRRRSSCSR